MDVVLHSPQSLVSSSGSTTSPGPDEPMPAWTWCFTPRNPLFLRPEAPRPQVRMGRCRHGRGAPSPAIPCSFVRKHHVPRSGWVDAGMDVVLHSPQSLVSSSGSTTSTGPDGPMPAWTWCTNPRNPLFFRFLCTKSPAPDGIGKGSADEFAIRLHFLPLLFCIDRKRSGAIAPLLFLHNPIKFYYFTFPLLFGAV